VRIVVASYNVHRCIGTDGKHDPDRTAAVLAELGADIIGLQEVDSGYHVEHGLDQIEYLARTTGLRPILSPTLRRHTKVYGNGFLSRLAFGVVHRVDLSVPRREPRGALMVDFEIDGEGVRVVNAHLGLRRYERTDQVRRILTAIGPADTERPLVLLGDFNEWHPQDLSMRALHPRFGRSRLRTFPSRRPLFALDRVLVEPLAVLNEVSRHATPLARRASDHLPVRAVIQLGAARSRAGLPAGEASPRHL
jgi:endonuclease/exonuclease/phosphatase family metal-dependent hydrolase